MAIRSEKYKEFMFSNTSENDTYKKASVISYNDKIKIEPPYTILINEQLEIIINEKRYSIPRILKHVIIFDKSTNGIISDNNVLEEIEKYDLLVAILEKQLLIIRSDIQNFNFYMIRQATILIDVIEKVLFFLSISIKELKNTSTSKLNNIEELLKNVKNSLYTKASFFDMLTSRTLNIVSLCALPILVIMTTWNASSSMNKKNVIIDEYYITYRISYLVAIILISVILYNYYQDFM